MTPINPPLALTAKQKLLSKLQGEALPPGEDSPPLEHIEDRKYYPLSSIQRRLYFLQEIEPESTAYHLPVAFHIHGPLVEARLKRAFEQVIARHESLRSSFSMVGIELVQHIHPEVIFNLEHGDPACSIHDQFAAFLIPFDLSKPPLLRAKVIKIADQEHVLMLDMHHIISDGTSMALILKEIALLYQGRTLPNLPHRYVDYIEWQKSTLSSSGLSKQKQYWQNQLSAPLPKLQLTTDRSRPSFREANGDQVFFSFDDDLTRELKRITGDEQVTLYMLLMAIYHVFLYKYTGQDDLIVGSSVEGRPLAPFKMMVGAFVNTLAIRSRPTPDQTFQTFLHCIKTTCLAALQNQDYPFEQLIEALPIEREVDRNPIFDTFFDFHSSRNLLTGFGDLKLTPLQLIHRAAKFDLSLEAVHKENHIEFCFEYSTACFNRETIERMAEHYTQIAKTLISAIDTPLQQIKITTPKEERLLLEDLNSLPSSISTDFCPYYKVFQEQVRIRPQAIAAVCEGVHLTYEALDQLSTKLAFQLVRLGLKEESIVGFLMDRGLDFLISLIAVFKTGGAYVPIDPLSPQQRIFSLIDESGSVFLLTSEKGAIYPCPTYCVSDLLAAPSSDYSNFDLHPHNKAYVIFTSGSTGKPKGAVIEHAGMMNHLWIKVKDLGLSAADVVAQTSSQTFDVSVWQFLVALMVGGKVIILPHEKAWDPQLLLSTIEKERITIFETVPSHMNLLLDEIDRVEGKYDLSTLRWMILNGEPMPNSILTAWHRHFPSIPMLNAYGPTECSDDVTHYKMFQPSPSTPDVIPIGKVLDNLGIYILDEQFNPVPYGLAGNLFVEGIGLGRGYLNDPAKTANAFLPFPFSISSKEGKRVYRTGDVARYLADGTILYLGRSDFQIKIRGQRIELGEIEAVLSQHEKILQAVVVAKAIGTEDKCLVAYLVLKGSYASEVASEAIIDEILHYASEKLPHSMIPSSLVLLASLPLLTNGKVNRSALPDPVIKQSIPKSILPPRTEPEVKLVKIWSELLKVPAISIDDNFFQLGGHSLLATQLIARIFQTFEVKLPLRLFFENPTIASLAIHLEKALISQGKIASEKLPILVPDHQNRYAEFPLTDVQQAYWLGRSGIFSLGEVSVHVYSEYDSSDIDLARLEKAWNLVIARHDALRLVFTPSGTQKILDPLQVPYYTIQCLDLRTESEAIVQEKLSDLRSRHSHEVFEATSWPLFSIQAVKMKEATRLYISFDSLIVDGWSVDIVFADWVRYYDDLTTSLETLELSFRDYVLGSRSIKKLPAYQVDKQYWLTRVERFPLAPRLPLVKTAEEVRQQTFSRSTFRLPKEEWVKMQKILLNKSLSATGVLAALFGDILQYYSNQNHLAINLTLFDRLPLHPQVNNISGDFTSLTLLEIDHRIKTPTFSARAQKVQQQLWRDLDHQLFSGVEFLHAMSQQHPKLDSGSLFPVVFTSVLGLDDKQNSDVQRIFGKEIFSITQTPQVWLDFKAYEIHGDLIIEWDFVLELFATGFVEQMHAHYCELLHMLAQDSKAWDLPLTLSLPTKQQQRRLAYNHTESPLKPRLLHEFLSEKAAIQPGHAAVICSEKVISYHQLDQIANQIGHFLRQQGVRPNRLVAIIMEKGWGQVAGAFGVLRAGGAYLPLDPNTPSLRLQELLVTGEVDFILTEHKMLERLKGLPHVGQLSPGHLIAIDDADASFHASPSSPLLSAQALSDLAYVIFTSGSTGVPKGVMISHEAACNTLLDINERFGISPSDRILALSSLTFDLSVYDIFGIIAAGGTVVMPEAAQVRNPAYWLEVLKSEKITVWNSVPMFMQMLVEHAQHRKVDSSLRLALLSGDWIPTHLPEKMWEIFSPNLRIVSLGGATEASIWSIYYEITPGESFAKSIPYGYPLSNQKFYVLNAQLQECPDTVEGELYIQGLGLSHGYWGNSARTRDAFIIHPQLGPLYKTGDRGRYFPSSGIEFLGRDDSQIKINGYRVDLQEIENVLCGHPDISQAALCSQTSASHHQQLVAYVTPTLLEPSQPFSAQIVDPQEILAFKLGRKNRRLQKGDQPVVFLPSQGSLESRQKTHFDRKSYRRFQGAKLSPSTILTWISESIATQSHHLVKHCASLSELSEVLEAFSAVASDGQLTVKYRYPSAGSLYPVQIYLEIGDCAVEGLEGGYYYYDPLTHTLLKLAPSSHKSLKHALSLFLIAKLDAIKPIYGPLAEDFCFLEAGYMMELLMSECNRVGLGAISLPPDPSLGASLSLDEDHLVLHSLSLNSPSQYLESPIPDSYLYIKESGWYVISQQGADAIAQGPEFTLSLVSQDNYAIFHEASFAIFFTEPVSITHSLHHQNLLCTGSISQRLQQHSQRFNIGTCAIGSLDVRGSACLQEVASGKQFVHGIFGGGISQDQINSTAISEPKQNIFQEVLTDYVSAHLPKYMVPSTIVALDKLPLSANGKLDRSALPQVEKMIKNHQPTLPQNDWEKRLVILWSEILKVPSENISTTDTFFELGGNSLLLIQLHNHITEIFKTSLSIDKLFQYPTIHSLAQFLSPEKSSLLDADAIAQSAQKLRSSRAAKRQAQNRKS